MIARHPLKAANQAVTLHARSSASSRSGGWSRSQQDRETAIGINMLSMPATIERGWMLDAGGTPMAPVMATVEYVSQATITMLVARWRRICIQARGAVIAATNATT